MRSERQVQALRAFETALEQLLAAHGARLTERGRIELDRRPGILVLSEAGIDEAYRPVLMVSCDPRDPAAFGLPIVDADA